MKNNELADEWNESLDYRNWKMFWTKYEGDFIMI